MKKANIILTSVLVALFLYLALPKGGGFLLILFLPLFLIYLIFNVVRMILKPAERRNRGIRLVVWSVALVLASCVQAYWSTASGKAAQSVAGELLIFKERAGSYPASLEEAGLDARILESEWKIRYSLREGKPRLSYPAPFMPLTQKEYDFEKGTWRQNAY